MSSLQAFSENYMNMQLSFFLVLNVHITDQNTYTSFFPINYEHHSDWIWTPAFCLNFISKQIKNAL